MKSGGGKLILKSDRVNCSEWSATGTGNEWINSERSWLAYLGGDGSDQVVLLERGRKMAVLLESWLAASHIDGL